MNIVLSMPSLLNIRHSGPVDLYIGCNRRLNPSNVGFMMGTDDGFVYPLSSYSSLSSCASIHRLMRTLNFYSEYEC